MSDEEVQTYVNPNYQTCTICTGDTKDNIWYVDGQCRLDQLSYDQVYYILSTVPKAKNDLLRITCDKNLIDLANTTPLIQPDSEADKSVTNLVNKNTIPFYTAFRGNIDGSIL